MLSKRQNLLETIRGGHPDRGQYRSDFSYGKAFAFAVWAHGGGVFDYFLCDLPGTVSENPEGTAPLSCVFKKAGSVL